MTSGCLPIVIILSAGILISGAVVTGWEGGYRLNETESYPLGLWRIERIERPIAVGDRVFICPPPTREFMLALERGYLRRGLCPGWLSPLIKTVAAIAGQRIEVDASVRIDGKFLTNSKVQGVDPQGRMLVPYAGGPVPVGALYLHSDYAGSYDSRYFGPLPAAGVLGFARPVLTFGS
jgi:conjugative transfer signal peptidase TraF